MNPIGVEYLTLHGSHPLHFIETVAKAGCSHVSLYASIETDPSQALVLHPYSYLQDRRLRHDTVACLQDNGVSIALLDYFPVIEGHSTRQFRPTFDILAEMGVTRINTAAGDPDWGRTLDEVGTLAEMAAEYGVTLTIEPIPVLPISSVAKALEIIAAVNLANVRLLIDTLHVSRSGEVDMLTTIDPMLIDYLQISDAPMAMPPSVEAYMVEACYERMVPGEGELPLTAFLQQLRPDVIVSVEVPLRRQRDAGMPDLERVKLAVDGARRALAVALPVSS